ncbi:hypothetical protein OS189_14355 [Sulfitobacter sp. F26169L]|uniref:hypothetical protein n=1 Tax=Sulfitobacter sp. F26169L TaxID=2996015 RepID=UPI002260E322|nr:hypothetical protein [Sulfitobacter sp. F26169L]MCX7567525.1 hypothetical protein [Sulfitobacter sp. F26169L]
MDKVKILVVGCGRSGTGYFAKTLQRNGIPATHEGIFNLEKELADSDMQTPFLCESSWYAAPYIDRIEGLTHVFHLVRNPLKVMSSFYRIGMLASGPLRHISQGYPKRYFGNPNRPAEKIAARTEFVMRHREFLQTNGQLFEPQTETGRLDKYWWHWNQMIEDKATKTGASYRRIQLEQLGNNVGELGKFFGLRGFTLDVPPQNLKMNYRPRKMPPTVLSEATYELARAYGYPHEYLVQ